MPAADGSGGAAAAGLLGRALVAEKLAVGDWAPAAMAVLNMIFGERWLVVDGSCYSGLQTPMGRAIGGFGA